MAGFAFSWCRRQAILQKRTVLAEDDPESLANDIEATNDSDTLMDDDQNWPPARPKKKVHVSPAEESDAAGSELEED
jgi:hypothetical protein